MNLDASMNRAVRGAALMIAGGTSYAGVNVMTQWAGTQMGIPSVTIAFWQYALATVLTLPSLWYTGIDGLRTRYLGWHITRVALVAAGIQIWIYSLTRVPIWQVIALSMTSPFFIILCARYFLKETVTPVRLSMAVVGFAGALIIIAPWSERYTAYSLLPVLVAALWAGYNVITKYLTGFEKPSAISLYMLLLLTPFNAVLWLAASVGSAASPHYDNDIWLALVAIGALTALGQYLQVAAYSVADIVFLQPFDDLRLPINVILGWLVFAAEPGYTFWPGAVLIAGASLFLIRHDSGVARKSSPYTARSRDCDRI